ncbi:MAG: hypothetical protein ACPGLY_13315 [Rubripirellula sp.]
MNLRNRLAIARRELDSQITAFALKQDHHLVSPIGKKLFQRVEEETHSCC